MVVPPIQSRLERQSDGAKGLPGIFASKRAGVKSRTGDGSPVLILYRKKHNKDRRSVPCPVPKRLSGIFAAERNGVEKPVPPDSL